MEHLDDDDFKVLYFSLEMGEVALYIKLLSIYIFYRFYGRTIRWKPEIHNQIIELIVTGKQIGRAHV